MNVNLTWNAVTLDDSGAPVNVSSYRLYRDGTVLANVAAPATNYTDNSVIPGSTHIYTLSAVSDSGVEGAQSESATVVIPTGVPAAPTDLVATLS